MYSARRYSFHAMSMVNGDHRWIDLLKETSTMSVVKDPKELQSELIIAEAYVAYWQYRADHVEQLTDLAASDTRSMLAKAQALLDILRRGDKPAPQRAAQVEPAPADAIDDLLGDDPVVDADEFL